MLNATIRIFPYDGLCGEWFTLGIRVGGVGSIVFSLPWDFAGMIQHVSFSPLPTANSWVWGIVSLPTVLTLDPLFLNNLPQSSFSRSVKSSRKEVSDEVFPPSQVYLPCLHLKWTLWSCGLPDSRNVNGNDSSAHPCYPLQLSNRFRFGSTFQKLLPSDLKTLKTS